MAVVSAATPYACAGPDNASYGNDPNFLQAPGFRPGPVAESILERGLEWRPGPVFGAETVKLAREFGYR